MRRIIAAWLLISISCAGAAAQQSGGSRLKWGQDLAQAAEQAKKSRLPLMLWIHGGPSDRDDAYDDLERDQNKAFGDERVQELSKRFVLCKVSRSRYRKELEKWGVREKANLDLVFVTPGGEQLDTLAPGGVASKDSLAQKMALVFNKHRLKIYDEEVKPKLEDEKAAAKDVLAALTTVSEFVIRTADPAVIKLLERGSGDAAVTKRAYDTLAVLSTREGIAAVFERAANDKRAADVLDNFTPGAAEYLVEHLDGQDDAKFLLAYRTVTRICKVQNVKNDKFWEGKNDKVKADEVKRVKDLVQKAARRWKERYDEYR